MVKGPKKSKRAPIFDMEPIFIECPHIHFKADTIDRGILSRQQHMNLLSTPKGYRWDVKKDDEDLGAKSDGSFQGLGSKYGPRVICGRRIRRPEKEYIHNFLAEIWALLTPEMIDRLKEMLMLEFGMSPTEAEMFVLEQKGKNMSRASVFMGRKGCGAEGCTVRPKATSFRTKEVSFRPGSNLTRNHACVKDFSNAMASKLMDYIVVQLSTKRDKKVKTLAERILKQLCDITGERCSLTDPKTRMHRILVFAADRLACWFAQNLGSKKKNACKCDTDEVDADIVKGFLKFKVPDFRIFDTGKCNCDQSKFCHCVKISKRSQDNYSQTLDKKASEYDLKASSKEIVKTIDGSKYVFREKQTQTQTESTLDNIQETYSVDHLETKAVMEATLVENYTHDYDGSMKENKGTTQPSAVSKGRSQRPSKITVEPSLPKIKEEDEAEVKAASEHEGKKTEVVIEETSEEVHETEETVEESIEVSKGRGRSKSIANVDGLDVGKDGGTKVDVADKKVERSKSVKGAGSKHDVSNAKERSKSPEKRTGSSKIDISKEKSKSAIEADFKVGGSKEKAERISEAKERPKSPVKRTESSKMDISLEKSKSAISGEKVEKSKSAAGSKVDVSEAKEKKRSESLERRTGSSKPDISRDKSKSAVDAGSKADVADDKVERSKSEKDGSKFSEAKQRSKSPEKRTANDLSREKSKSAVQSKADVEKSKSGKLDVPETKSVERRGSSKFNIPGVDMLKSAISGQKEGSKSIKDIDVSKEKSRERSRHVFGEKVDEKSLAGTNSGKKLAPKDADTEEKATKGKSFKFDISGENNETKSVKERATVPDEKIKRSTSMKGLPGSKSDFEEFVEESAVDEYEAKVEKSARSKTKDAETIEKSKEQSPIKSFLKKSLKSLKEMSPMKSIREMSPIKSIKEMSPINSIKEMSPIKSIRGMSPIKSIREMSPIKSLRELSPLKSLKSLREMSPITSLRGSKEEAKAVEQPLEEIFVGQAPESREIQKTTTGEISAIKEKSSSKKLDVETEPSSKNLDGVSIPDMKTEPSSKKLDGGTIPDMKTEPSSKKLDGVSIPDMKTEPSSKKLDGVSIPDMKTEPSSKKLDGVSIPDMKTEPSSKKVDGVSIPDMKTEPSSKKLDGVSIPDMKTEPSSKKLDGVSISDMKTEPSSKKLDGDTIPEMKTEPSSKKLDGDTIPEMKTEPSSKKLGGDTMPDIKTEPSRKEDEIFSPDSRKEISTNDLGEISVPVVFEGHVGGEEPNVELKVEKNPENGRYGVTLKGDIEKVRVINDSPRSKQILVLLESVLNGKQLSREPSKRETRSLKGSMKYTVPRMEETPSQPGSGKLLTEEVRRVVRKNVPNADDWTQTSIDFNELSDVLYVRDVGCQTDYVDISDDSVTDSSSVLKVAGSESTTARIFFLEGTSQMPKKKDKSKSASRVVSKVVAYDEERSLEGGVYGDEVKTTKSIHDKSTKVEIVTQKVVSSKSFNATSNGQRSIKDAASTVSENELKSDRETGLQVNVEKSKPEVGGSNEKKAEKSKSAAGSKFEISGEKSDPESSSKKKLHLTELRYRVDEAKQDKMMGETKKVMKSRGSEEFAKSQVIKEGRVEYSTQTERPAKPPKSPLKSKEAIIDDTQADRIMSTLGISTEETDRMVKKPKLKRLDSNQRKAKLEVLPAKSKSVLFADSSKTDRIEQPEKKSPKTEKMRPSKSNGVEDGNRAVVKLSEVAVSAAALGGENQSADDSTQTDGMIVKLPKSRVSKEAVAGASKSVQLLELQVSAEDIVRPAKSKSVEDSTQTDRMIVKFPELVVSAQDIVRPAKLDSAEDSTQTDRMIVTIPELLVSADDIVRPAKSKSAEDSTKTDRMIVKLPELLVSAEDIIPVQSKSAEDSTQTDRMVVKHPELAVSVEDIISVQSKSAEDSTQTDRVKVKLPKHQVSAEDIIQPAKSKSAEDSTQTDRIKIKLPELVVSAEDIIPVTSKSAEDSTQTDRMKVKLPELVVPAENILQPAKSKSAEDSTQTDRKVVKLPESVVSSEVIVRPVKSKSVEDSTQTDRKVVKLPELVVPAEGILQPAKSKSAENSTQTDRKVVKLPALVVSEEDITPAKSKSAEDSTQTDRMIVKLPELLVSAEDIVRPAKTKSNEGKDLKLLRPTSALSTRSTQTRKKGLSKQTSYEVVTEELVSLPDVIDYWTQTKKSLSQRTIITSETYKEVEEFNIKKDKYSQTRKKLLSKLEIQDEGEDKSIKEPEEPAMEEKVLSPIKIPLVPQDEPPEEKLPEKEIIALPAEKEPLQVKEATVEDNILGVKVPEPEPMVPAEASAVSNINILTEEAIPLEEKPKVLKQKVILATKVQGDSPSSTKILKSEKSEEPLADYKFIPSVETIENPEHAMTEIKEIIEPEEPVKIIKIESAVVSEVSLAKAIQIQEEPKVEVSEVIREVPMVEIPIRDEPTIPVKLPEAVPMQEEPKVTEVKELLPVSEPVKITEPTEHEIKIPSAVALPIQEAVEKERGIEPDIPSEPVKLIESPEKKSSEIPSVKADSIQEIVEKVVPAVRIPSTLPDVEPAKPEERSVQEVPKLPSVLPIQNETKADEFEVLSSDISSERSKMQSAEAVPRLESVVEPEVNEVVPEIPLIPDYHTEPLNSPTPKEAQKLPLAESAVAQKIEDPEIIKDKHPLVPDISVRTFETLPKEVATSPSADAVPVHEEQKVITEEVPIVPEGAAKPILPLSKKTSKVAEEIHVKAPEIPSSVISSPEKPVEVLVEKEPSVPQNADPFKQKDTDSCSEEIRDSCSEIEAMALEECSEDLIEKTLLDSCIELLKKFEAMGSLFRTKSVGKLYEECESPSTTFLEVDKQFSEEILTKLYSSLPSSDKELNDIRISENAVAMVTSPGKVEEFKEPAEIKAKIIEPSQEQIAPEVIPPIEIPELVQIEKTIETPAGAMEPSMEKVAADISSYKEPTEMPIKANEPSLEKIAPEVVAPIEIPKLVQKIGEDKNTIETPVASKELVDEIIENVFAEVVKEPSKGEVLVPQELSMEKVAAKISAFKEPTEMPTEAKEPLLEKIAPEVIVPSAIVELKEPAKIPAKIIETSLEQIAPEVNAPIEIPELVQIEKTIETPAEAKEPSMEKVAEFSAFKEPTEMTTVTKGPSLEKIAPEVIAPIEILELVQKIDEDKKTIETLEATKKPSMEKATSKISAFKEPSLEKIAPEVIMPNEMGELKQPTEIPAAAKEPSMEKVPSKISAFKEPTEIPTKSKEASLEKVASEVIVPNEMGELKESTEIPAAAKVPSLEKVVSEVIAPIEIPELVQIKKTIETPAAAKEPSLEKVAAEISAFKEPTEIPTGVKEPSVEKIAPEVIMPKEIGELKESTEIPAAAKVPSLEKVASETIEFKEKIEIPIEVMEPLLELGPGIENKKEFFQEIVSSKIKEEDPNAIKLDSQEEVSLENIEPLKEILEIRQVKVPSLQMIFPEPDKQRLTADTGHLNKLVNEIIDEVIENVFAEVVKEPSNGEVLAPQAEEPNDFPQGVKIADEKFSPGTEINESITPIEQKVSAERFDDPQRIKSKTSVCKDLSQKTISRAGSKHKIIQPPIRKLDGIEMPEKRVLPEVEPPRTEELSSTSKNADDKFSLGTEINEPITPMEQKVSAERFDDPQRIRSKTSVCKDPSQKTISRAGSKHKIIQPPIRKLDGIEMPKKRILPEVEPSRTEELSSTSYVIQPDDMSESSAVRKFVPVKTTEIKDLKKEASDDMPLKKEDPPKITSKTSIYRDPSQRSLSKDKLVVTRSSEVVSKMPSKKTVSIILSTEEHKREHFKVPSLKTIFPEKDPEAIKVPSFDVEKEVSKSSLPRISLKERIKVKESKPPVVEIKTPQKVDQQLKKSPPVSVTEDLPKKDDILPKKQETSSIFSTITADISPTVDSWAFEEESLEISEESEEEFELLPWPDPTKEVTTKSISEPPPESRMNTIFKGSTDRPSFPRFQPKLSVEREVFDQFGKVETELYKKIAEWFDAVEVGVTKSDRQIVMSEIIEKKLSGSQHGDGQDVGLAEKIAAWVDREVDQIEKAEIRKPVCKCLKKKGPTFHVRRDGYAYDITPISDELVKTKVAENRSAYSDANEENTKVGPLLKSEFRAWARWACDAVLIAEQWANWIDDTCMKAQMKVLDRKEGSYKCRCLDEKEYKQWQKKVQDDALEWQRNKHLLIKVADFWLLKTQQS